MKKTQLNPTEYALKIRELLEGILTMFLITSLIEFFNLVLLIIIVIKLFK